MPRTQRRAGLRHTAAGRRVREPPTGRGAARPSRSPLGVNGIAIRLAVADERCQVIVDFQHVHPGVTKPAARQGNGSIKRGAGGACAAREVAVRT